MLDEGRKMKTSSLFSFQHNPATSFLLGPDILLSGLLLQNAYQK
jgi:hypothetical protein